jgi:hypothetical protein
MPWVPCRRFAACKRSLNWRGSHNLTQNYQLILAHIVRPFATGISCVVDMGAPGGEHGKVQTGGGDRVSSISLLGCSTSVTLATGPTDEEEEDAHFSIGVRVLQFKTSVLEFHWRRVVFIVVLSSWNKHFFHYIMTFCLMWLHAPHM